MHNTFEVWKQHYLPEYPATPIIKPLENKYKNFIQPKNPENFYRKISYLENAQLLDITYFLHTRGAESYYRPKYSICPQKLNFAFIPNLDSLDKIQSFIPISIQNYIDNAIYKLEHIGIFNNMVFPVIITNFLNNTSQQNSTTSPVINIRIGGVALFTFNASTNVDDIIEQMLELLTQCNSNKISKSSNHISQVGIQQNTQPNTNKVKPIRTMSTSFYSIN